MRIPLATLLCSALLVACGGGDASSAAGGGAGAGGTAARSVTAGGCACPADAREVELSLTCFCAEFPDGCPSYDQARMRKTQRCFDATQWWETEQTGCGQLILKSHALLGVQTFVYDQQTHELLGAALGSDNSLGACSASLYVAGVPATCAEGSVCSVCDEAGAACAPACSAELAQHLAPGTKLSPAEACQQL